MNYEKLEKQYYEKSWGSLSGRCSNVRGSYQSKEPSDYVKKYISYLKKNKISGNVLDIGCGNGRHTALFAKNGFKTSGIDISNAAIKLAKNNARDNDVKMSLQAGSVFRLPYKTKSFDALLDSGCLHHLRKSEWKKYLTNVDWVLKNGGYFLLYCFSQNFGHMPKFSPKTKNRNWTLRNGHYNHFFSDQEVKDLFDKKFKIINNYELTKWDSVGVFKVYLMRKI